MYQWRWWWFTTQPGFGNSWISSIAASSPWKIGIRLATIPSWSFEGDLEHLGDHVEKFQEVCWAPGSKHGFSWNLLYPFRMVGSYYWCAHMDALMTDHYWYYCGILWRCRLMHVLYWFVIYVLFARHFWYWTRQANWWEWCNKKLFWTLKDPIQLHPGGHSWINQATFLNAVTYELAGFS